MPPIRYPEDLPVSARRGEILEALRAHQVLVIAGETGSDGSAARSRGGWRR